MQMPSPKPNLSLRCCSQVTRREAPEGAGLLAPELLKDLEELLTCPITHVRTEHHLLLVTTRWSHACRL